MKMRDDPLTMLILDLLRSHPSGLNNKQLAELVPQTPVLDIVQSLNALLADRVVQLNQSGNDLIYTAVDEEEAVLLKNMTQEENLVYSHIKQSANKGIWMKDLVKNTNLHRMVVTKVLKSMEGRGLIKPVKSVKTPTRKIYMLASLEPSLELSGGAFFTDQELDVELVHHLGRAALHYIRQQCQPKSTSSSHRVTGCTVEEVQNFIDSSGIIEMSLMRSDVSELLEMMVYAGKLIKLQKDESLDSILFYPVPSKDEDDSHQEEMEGTGGASEIPCFVCPVFDKCGTTPGLISPETCVYFKEWLSLE